MNIEANRLATFASWPSHFPIEVVRIARGGFFATGRDQEAECHWCRQRISDWRYGDQVMIRHRLLDPLCPFVTDSIRSGNVPTLENLTARTNISTYAALTSQPPPPPPPPPPQQQLASQPAQSDSAAAADDEEPDNRGADGADDVGPDYMNEQCRLGTFTNWPITCVTPRSLARAGFYYYNQSDHVRCAWCQGVIAKWEQGDDPFVEHSKFFPRCPRAMCGPNVRMLDCDDRSIEAIGIQPHQPSRHDAFASLDVRLQTFQTWQHAHVQRPDALAAAGFYYLDTDDYVRCFHCSGGLRSWQPDDDPWHEHAKYFPRCAFVELVRGRAFVQKVQAGQPPTLETAMLAEWPRRAQEMGFAAADVEQVVAQRIEMTGAPYHSLDDLLVAILSLKVAAADVGVEVQVAEEVEAAGAAAASSASAGAAIGGAASTASAAAAVEPAEVIVSNGEAASTPTTTSPPLPVAGNSGATSASPTDEGTTQSLLYGMADGRGALNLEDENRKLKDAIQCKVCMVEEVGIVFLPCGHLVSCVQCASSVTACPLCRTKIKAYVRTYLS